MENKINIEKLLKDCPKGMELDCLIYENVTLVQVLEGHDYPIVIETPNGQMYLSKYGCFSKNEFAKCVIFPKGETTWEGFVPPYKFKDGDRVVKKGDISTPVSIVRVGDKYYYHYSNTEGTIGLLPIAEQDDWELVSNKFDITTLVPFESRVLMRSSNAREWVGTIYSHYSNNKFYGCGMCCDQCIPYEGNQHLLGTTNDCDKFYKNWE